MDTVRKTSIYYIIFILAIGAASIGLLFLRFRAGHTESAPFAYTASLNGPTVSIPVVVADTPALREQGLSGTASLPKEGGMLFAFDAPGKYGFWMKDMRYPLDFIWLDQQMTIVDITVSVMPDSYPQVFYPKDFSMYMVEVNADFSTAHGLKIGQKLALTKK